MPPPLEFLGEWGVKGNDPGQIYSPHDIAADFAGRVYIVNGHNTLDSIDKFDPRGTPLMSFTDKIFDNILALAVDRGGAIYTTNYTRNLVLIFFPDGSPLRNIRGGPGLRFRGPRFLAVDNDGNLFVDDSESFRIQKFDAKGRFRKAWGKKGLGDGEFLSIGGLAVGPDGHVYVADGTRIQKFTSEGALLAVFSAKDSSGFPVGSLDGLAVSTRFIISADPIRHQILAWTMDGHLIHQENLEGRLNNPGGYGTPRRVALTPNGELFTLDPTRYRVLRFRINF